MNPRRWCYLVASLLLLSVAAFAFVYFTPITPTIAKNSSRKTVCLNMIVKNESSVIERCLTSMLPLIDYWVIVDTGSNDRTQQIIKDFMKKNGIPGELHERPWVNFSHNRNEALSLAKGKSDYMFFIDADEYLVYQPDFKLPDLDKDYYYVTLEIPGIKYTKIQLVKSQLDWKYVGVLHEVLCPPQSATTGHLDKVLNIYTTDGARSKDPQKYQKDAQILEAALIDEPDNSRYMFYLAQSYANSKNPVKALETYQKRAGMIGFYQETFWSLFQIGVLQEELKYSSDAIVESYRRAFEYNRTRAEPLYSLASYYRRMGDFEKGYQIAALGLSIPKSQESLYVLEWMYDYGLLLEYSICAYWIGHYQECQQLSLALLNRNNLPQNVRDCVQQNLGFANQKLLEQICTTPPLTEVSAAEISRAS